MWISIESCIPGTIFSDCTQKLYSNGKMVFLLLTKRDIFFLFSSFSFSILFFLNNKECTFPLHFVFLCKIFLRFVLFFSTIKYFFPKYFFLIPNWSSWPSDNQGFKVHYWVWNAQYTRSNFYMGFVGNGKVFFSTFWNMHSFKCNDVAFWHIILYSCPSRSIPTYLADWLSDCHGGPGGHGQDTQERQNLHLNLTFQVNLSRAASQFLRCLLFSCFFSILTISESLDENNFQNCGQRQTTTTGHFMRGRPCIM